MNFPRSSGILLHLTSLPGGLGIGDLGESAYRFVDFLVENRQSVWQVLPLGPTSQGNEHSPYVALSAFAGNPLLISVDTLREEGLLPASLLASAPSFPEGEVNYEAVSRCKFSLLRTAAARFSTDASPTLRAAFAKFCQEQRWWLDDYALFMALREVFGDAAWNTWGSDLVHRYPVALADWRAKLKKEILFYQLLQFFFFTQWARLRAYANQRGVRIFGDLPIYVAFDSVEVWSRPELFLLDAETHDPLFVAGVPPDAFSATGQRWGNPLYRWWDENGSPIHLLYEWWIRRFRAALQLVELIRIDHFRGFEAYWSVPAQEETAINGQWIKGPGAGLFTAVRDTLGELPVVAEDLGIITPDVDVLRRQFGLPGMKVLQFAFDGDPHNRYLPHNYTDPHYVVYTGTHDNDTTHGWFSHATPEHQAAVLRYLGREPHADLHWDFIRLALSSVALLAVIPLQDVLGLGSEGRMNIPGQEEGNWRWRCVPEALNPEVGARLAELTHMYAREVG